MLWPRFSAHRIVWFWVSFLSYTISTSMTAPLIGLHAHSLGASSAEIGVIYGIAALTTFIARLPLASLQTSLGSKFLIKAGVVTNSVSLLTYAFSPSYQYMYLGSILRGVGFASFHPSALSEAVRLSGRQDRLGWMMTAPPLGMSLGPAVSSALLTLFNELFDLRLAYFLVFLCGAGFSGAALLVSSMQEETENLNPSQPMSLSKLLEKDMLLLVSSRLVLSYVVGAITAILPVFIVRSHILSEPEVPLLFSWGSVFNMLGRPLSSLLKSPFRGILAGSISMTISGIFLLNANTMAVYAAMAFYGLALGFYIPSSLLMVQSLISSSQLTLGIAVLTLAIDLGASLGSFGTGILMQKIDTALLLSASAVFSGLLSLLLTYGLGKSRDRQEKV